MFSVSRLLVLLCLTGVAVCQNVIADFGSRLNQTYRISPTMIGAQYSNIVSSSAHTSLYNGGFRSIRMYGWLQVVFANGKTPNWSKLDSYLDAAYAIKTNNKTVTPGQFIVILELTYTPRWLMPTTIGCVQPGTANDYKLPPKDVNQWADLAVQVYAHANARYKGLVTDLEIWNEPELGWFCTNPNTSTNRVAKYLQVYGAAAPKLKAQAAKDGVTVRIGGPAIVNTSAASQWVGGLVTNPLTAPYVDFVSFHQYPTGNTELMNGDSTKWLLWDKTSSANVAPLYPRIGGMSGSYITVAKIVKAGLQPNPTQTKIYMDEYNTNWAFSDDCCRNSATYSPLFNGKLMVNLLDSVYSGAHRVPDTLSYYSVSSPPFCLVGDAGGHCGASSFSTMYPQYYLYKMLAMPSYLGLLNGGYMAKSISPLPSTSYGLQPAAFWTTDSNSIFIVNPSSTSYSAVKVIANNPGLNVGHVTKLLLNSTNKTITSSAASFTNTTTSGVVTCTSTTVSIPAYSVVALKFTL